MPKNRLPAHFIAYELSTLDEIALRVAAERNLIRPDVGRQELVTLKGHQSRIGHRGPAHPIGDGTVSLPALRRRGDRICLEFDK